MSTQKVKSFWSEEWVKVDTRFPTKDRYYFISNHGRIKVLNYKTGEENLLKGSISSTYNAIGIKFRNGKNQGFYIHKFVAEHFLKDKREDHEHVIHKDGNKRNNHWTNLKWITKEELYAIRREKGTYHRDKIKRPKHYKMTIPKVILLKKRLRDGKTKKKILARDFNITLTQLKRIERGENWGDIKIPDDDKRIIGL